MLELRRQRNGRWTANVRYSLIVCEGKDPNEAVALALKAEDEKLEAMKAQRAAQIEAAKKRKDLRLTECHDHEKICGCNRVWWDPIGYFIEAKCGICGEWKDASREGMSPIEYTRPYVCGSCDLY